MADARKDRRTLLSLKIRYKSATLEDFIERYSNDISRGGVFIKAKKPLAVGTLLKFEFLLENQSPLIHGVGRVVWRREEHESNADNPAGMGIKFIKMDPESRAIVARIADERALPGVFDQGKEGARGAAASDAGGLGGGDQTKVRHVSEFLASALEEGGAGRRTAARGAFGSFREATTERRQAGSEAPARGVMSAFGGSTASAGISRSSAAPALNELDDDDFFDEETTKVKEMPLSDYPDADATAIAKDVSPFLREKRPTPVVPMVSPSSSPLEDEVPELFGAADLGSFESAADEVIDPRLLDQSDATVPPRAATVPDANSSAAGVFQVPKAAPAIEDPVKTSQKRQTRGWMALLLLVLLTMAAAVAALRFGLLDGLIERVAPGFAPPAAYDETPALGAHPVRASSAPSDSTARSAPAARVPETEAESEPAAVPPEASRPVAPAKEATPEPASNARMAKLRVLSVPNGAFVSIGGKAVGRTPLEVEYAVGTELSVFSKARGFLARREKIVVQADQEPLKLVLSALPYVIEVASDPPGAEVSVAGVVEGVTPTTIELEGLAGARKILISKDGYDTVTKSLTRGSFIEEPRRMVAKISVGLQPLGASNPASPAPTDDTVESEPVEGNATAQPEPVAKTQAVLPVSDKPAAAP